ncbi:MAG: Rpn family recombination-promoting nuclease/putative transposase [Porticoccaceae bacterium]
MPKTLLDPKNDFVFKKLFAESPDLLANLIDAVRGSEGPIEIIEVPNSAIDIEELTGKFIVLDVLARDNQGRLLNIELQIRCRAAWIERSFYYLARAYVDQLKQEDRCAVPKPVIGINFLDFDLFAGEQAHWHFKFQDGIQRELALGHMQLHVLELCKFDRQHPASNALIDWISWLKHWHDDSVMSEIHHPAVHQAHDKLRRLSQEEDTRSRAHARERFLHKESSFFGGMYHEQSPASEKKRSEESTHVRERDQATLITQLLTLKFGEPPSEIQQRLYQAREAELDRWAARILFAQTPADVFG